MTANPNPGMPTLPFESQSQSDPHQEVAPARRTVLVRLNVIALAVSWSTMGVVFTILNVITGGLQTSSIWSAILFSSLGAALTIAMVVMGILRNRRERRIVHASDPS